MKFRIIITAFVTAITAAVMLCAAAQAQSDVSSAQMATAEEIILGKGRGGTSAVLYDSSNGLPTSDSNVITQTSDGFIWIGSYSGLIRYDGNEFYRYDASYGISNVVSLYEDTKKRLWIGTNDSGAVCYEKGEFSYYSKDDGLRSSSIRSISEDNDGNILLATTLGMAYVDADGALKILDDAQLNREYIGELRRTADGTVYGETYSGAVFTINALKVSSFYHGVMEDLGGVNCICPDPEANGRAYIGMSNSCVVYADISGGMNDHTVIDVSPLRYVIHIGVQNGATWICCDNGIGVYTKEAGFRVIEDLPMNNSVGDMTVDYEGNLWFSSSRQGVMKISASRFADLNHAAGLPSFVVNTTCLYGEDLYIGTDTGLYILDKNSAQKTSGLTERLENVRIRSIKEDSGHNLWLSTYGEDGLVCLKSSGEIVCFNSGNGLPADRIRVTEELSDGRIAVSVSGNGIVLIKDFQIVGRYSSENGINNSEILSVCEGDNGVIYLGSDGDGVYVVNGNSVTRLGIEDGLRSEVIMRIKKDPLTNTYWFVTSNSLAYMKDGQIKTLSTFPYSNNFDIIFDNSGGAWVLSSNGIYVTGTRQLMLDNKPEYMFYDTSCGLPSVATANSRSFLDAGGDLYIAGNSGVSVINIYAGGEENKDIRLTIPFVEIDGKLCVVDETNTIRVPYNSRRITIYGYALTFSLKNPRLSYFLAGFDDEAATVLRQDMGPVSYTNLDGGTYEFRLSLINTLTGNPEREVYITVMKDTAFYKTPWFIALVVAAAGVLILLAVRIYTRHKTAVLLKKQEEKQLLIDEVIQAFAKCIDMKDKYTNGHSFRVAQYSKLLSEKMGFSEADAKDVYNVALLHDIGKISIPDSVLNKPGRPTDEEYATLKTHSQNGYEILKDITIAPELAYGAGYHHERLDGKGYPRGLAGDEIPMVAQIIAVADTFDAMYSTRPYRKQMDIHDVLKELERVAGTQLNGAVVDKLAELVDEGKIEQVKL